MCQCLTITGTLNFTRTVPVRESMALERFVNVSRKRSSKEAELVDVEAVVNLNHKRENDLSIYQGEQTDRRSLYIVFSHL